MRRFILCLLIAWLLGCAQPLPPERAHYVGMWQANEMAILITADGSVAYKRLKGGVTTSVNGPLKEFVGDSFVVGVGPLVTTFDVSEAPHLDNGVWTMTVDGVTLTRASSASMHPPDML